jgi:hypothetical protein
MDYPGSDHGTGGYACQSHKTTGNTGSAATDYCAGRYCDRQRTEQR